MPKGGSHFVFLSVISIDPVSETGKNYHLQAFLE